MIGFLDYVPMPAELRAQLTGPLLECVMAAGGVKALGVRKGLPAVRKAVHRVVEVFAAFDLAALDGGPVDGVATFASRLRELAAGKLEGKELDSVRVFSAFALALAMEAGVTAEDVDDADAA